jgi:putative phage-type endonuclease
MIEQQTPEWHQQRLGKLTASKMADALARTKSGWGASRFNLMAGLVAERLTGISQVTYTNAAMQWGTDTEPQAKAAYEFKCDIDIEPASFVDHPAIAMSGASPDGYVGKDGLIEIKCPNIATHIDTLLGADIDGRYVKQMQWQMACTGRAWCDFASFDPRLPPEMQLHIRRVHRDDKLIAEMEKEGAVFLDEVAARVSKLQTMYQLKQMLRQSVEAAE